MDNNTRQLVFMALVGSHNYNLNTEESDRDYKAFYLPTFDDLYDVKQYSHQQITETMDIDSHDIRKLSQLWWKANLNFLEVLFSEEIIINSALPDESLSLVNMLLQQKDNIAKMNLPYLFNSSLGTHTSKIKQLLKGTQTTQKLVDKFGYDTKQAMHAIRTLDFLVRFADSGFTNFKEAIYYPSNTIQHDLLLDIKHEKYTLEEFLELDKKYLEKAKSYEDKYKEYSADAPLLDTLKTYIKEIIKNSLKEELVSEVN